MALMVAYSNTAEGAAALEQGRQIAARLDCAVVVFDLDRESHADDRSVDPPDGDGAGTERWLGFGRSAPVPVEDMLDTAQELGVEAIVVGVRRRSPVGKLIMGSNAQRIILGASVPVVAVKAQLADA